MRPLVFRLGSMGYPGTGSSSPDRRRRMFLGLMGKNASDDSRIGEIAPGVSKGG
jgi:hypothetical protein